jgi:hypothetical protein
LKIFIKNVIKQPGLVDAGLLPVQPGPVRSVPVGAGAADRLQETLYINYRLQFMLVKFTVQNRENAKLIFKSQNFCRELFFAFLMAFRVSYRIFALLS